MKRVFCFLTVLILLVSSCAKAPAPQPVYGIAPQKSAEGVTIQGNPLPALFEQEGKLYVRMADFATAIGGTFEVTEGLEIHTAKFTKGLGEINFTTDSLPPEGVCTLYLSGSIYDGTDWYHPLEEVMKYYDHHSFRDEENKHTYYTEYPLAEELAEGYKVPTLMYHAVSDDCWGYPSLFVSPANLEKQLQYLAENGYTTITFEDLARIDQIEKPVLLTFDDGYEDNYTELFPLLKKYNAKATVFMIMNCVGKEIYLNAEQIKEMDASGLVSFQSHTMTHEFLSTRTPEQLEHELYDSKLALARLIGKEPFVLCYPTGKYSEASIKATGEYYQFGLLMSGKNYVTGDDPLKITRKYIARSTTLESFKAMLK